MTKTSPSNFAQDVTVLLDRFYATTIAHREVAAFVKSSLQPSGGIEEVFAQIAFDRFPEIEHQVHLRVASVFHQKVHEHIDQRALEKQGEPTEDGWRVKWEQDLSEKIEAITKTHSLTNFYKGVWRESQSQGRRAPIVRSSLLMGVVSDFEMLVAGLIRLNLSNSENLLKQSEKSLTWKQMSEFDSLRDIRIQLSDEYVSNVMRGGLDAWMNWFNKKLNLVVDGVTTEADELLEIFQRRHLLVHNGGVVNRQYMDKLGFRDGVQIGDKVGVSHKYLSAAIESLTSAGVKLALSNLAKLGSKDDNTYVEHQITRYCYNALKMREWDVVINICEWSLARMKSDDHKLPIQVNLWLAKKLRDGLTAIKADVESWPVSTRSKVYQLAKLALLDQHGDAYALACNLIDAGDLTLQEWHDWPLLEDVRAFEVDHVPENEWMPTLELDYVSNHMH